MIEKTIEIEPANMKKKIKKNLPAAAPNTVVGSAQHQSSFQKKNPSRNILCSFWLGFFLLKYKFSMSVYFCLFCSKISKKKRSQFLLSVFV